MKTWDCKTKLKCMKYLYFIDITYYYVPCTKKAKNAAYHIVKCSDNNKFSEIMVCISFTNLREYAIIGTVYPLHCDMKF